MREGNEKERDCSVSRINTYRVGVQSEKNFFTQELGVDLDYVSRVFMVKQMEYHREMYSKLEQVYHQCWPSEEQPQGKNFFDMSCEYLDEKITIQMWNIPFLLIESLSSLGLSWGWAYVVLRLIKCLRYCFFQSGR